MSSRRGGGGPIGGVIKMLGTGVGAVAEYREHRKDQKLSRENSRQSAEAASTGTSPQPSPAVTPAATTSDQPPAYTDIVPGTSDRSLAAGKPASDDKKAALAQYDEDDSSDDDSDASSIDDEEDWRLDDLQHVESAELPSYNESEKSYGNTDELVQQVMRRNTLKEISQTPSQPFIHQPLPFPVLIPQRRPRNKTRGFIRAYAPVLGECSGIDQDTFLQFLENFYKSSQASPVFGVIELSAAIAGFAPEPITMAVTTAVQVAARTGEELQARYRTNQFLNKMNDELFKPAGCYAMIVKYKSQAEVDASANSLLARFGVAASTVDFNTNQTIAKYSRTTSTNSMGSDGSGRGMSDRMKDLRLASGTTRGAINLPAAAPLVFPEIDKKIATEGEETFKDKAKDAQSFLADYMDRRAHMRYARDDPNSQLVVPESHRQYKSKLADPNHPAFSGGVINLATGGYLAKQRGGLSKREAREERRLDKYERRMDSGRYLSRKKQRRYDAYMCDRNMREGGDYSQGGYGSAPRRRGPGGPIGLVIGAGTGAYHLATGNKGKSREYEDSYSNRPAAPPAPAEEYGRRSFDERSGRPQYESNPAALTPEKSAPAAYAGYGGGNAAASPGQYMGGNPAAAPGQYLGRRPPQGRARGGGPLGAVKRIMTEDVLYLMIVNMPSEEEMAEMREKLERAKNEK